MFNDIFFCDHLNGLECFDFDGTGDGYGYSGYGYSGYTPQLPDISDYCIISGRSLPKNVYLSGGRSIPDGWYPRKHTMIGKKVPRSPRNYVEVPHWLVASKKKAGAKRKEFPTID